MVEICICILLLHRKQLHVSALDNGHIQVVHESNSKQLYKYIYIYMGYLYGERRGVKWVRELVSVRVSFFFTNYSHRRYIL